MVKTLHPTAGGRGSTLRWGTKIPNVVGAVKKTEKKKIKNKTTTVPYYTRESA